MSEPRSKRNASSGIPKFPQIKYPLASRASPNFPSASTTLSIPGRGHRPVSSNFPTLEAEFPFPSTAVHVETKVSRAAHCFRTKCLKLRRLQRCEMSVLPVTRFLRREWRDCALGHPEPRLAKPTKVFLLLFYFPARSECCSLRSFLSSSRH